MKRAFVILAVLLLAPGTMRAAASAAALYNQGNDQYKALKFAEARQSYQQALATGLRNADLYFNLGNAELKSGELGQAIADYLRAQRLKPRDPDVAFNLAYARAMISARLPELPQGPFTRAFNVTVDFLSANEWTALALAAYWVMAGALVTLIASSRKMAKKTARTALYVGIAVFLITLPFTAARVKRDVFTPRAVILAEKVAARSGPGEENAALFDLVQGIDVVVGQCESGWCKVSAPGGFMGWVDARSFERL
jgi:tetratricopeptide (TPR) repeat protein